MSAPRAVVDALVGSLGAALERVRAAPEARAGPPPLPCSREARRGGGGGPATASASRPDPAAVLAAAMVLAHVCCDRASAARVATAGVAPLLGAVLALGGACGNG